MAASGLDHLKSGYRRRFCRCPGVPDINMGQGQNILVILQDCFEEKSLLDDFSTNSAISVPSSTPKIKDTCLRSPSREKSHSESVPVSSRKERASLQFTINPSKAVSRSAESHEFHQKVLATDVDSKNTRDSRKMSSKKLKDHCNEADEEFYLSVGSPSVFLDAKTSVLQNAISPVAQKTETYTFENSINILSSNTEISTKTKKRLNFEDKDILKKVEIENEVSDVELEVSERPQEKKAAGTPQKIIQDSEYEIQPQAKKSFSTLFLETLKRKSESSPIVRHTATAPPHSSPANDTKLLEDEFIIDESDRSFASRPWITIPRKSVSQKQRTVYPTDSTALHQSKKSREKHCNVSPVTLTSDKHSSKAHPVEKSPPSEQKNLSRNCALTDKMESNCRSTKYEMYSENAEKSSGSKRTRKEKQKRKVEANVVEEQVDVEQSKDKNLNMSHIAQDKSQRDSDRNMQECEEMKNVRISKKQMPPVGSKKSSTNVLHTDNRKKNREREKKDFSVGSKKNELVLEEVTPTVMRSQRISRPPSNWWVVKLEQSKYFYLNYVNSVTGSSKNEENIVTAKNIHLKPQTREYPCKTAEVSDSDSGEPKTLVLEGSGPFRLKNYLMSGKNNSDVGDEEVQQNSDDSIVTRSKTTQENKIHHKLVLPSNTPNVRRTKRIRLKPLEYWRGERIDYQGRPSGGFVIGGILSPDTISPKRKAKGEMKKVNEIVNRKRICPDSNERKNKLVVNLDIPLGDPLQPTRVKDPETRKMILMDLLRPRDTYQFSIEHGELKVYKTLDTPLFSTGKLILGPHQEKGKQHVGLDILLITLLLGNYYNIKNLLNEESVLLFTQIKR
ncbi:PREDICTED: centromere protein C [Hipposideros armiger]|uniref:Centromere protein C n=1 Tax=Hipposideros armiger TaxID=186990 RepID=A0A8B7QQ37_HIPAR|nr:PREDICTED: centromere protein C [Hipposideros armiger]